MSMTATTLKIIIMLAEKDKAKKLHTTLGIVISLVCILLILILLPFMIMISIFNIIGGTGQDQGDFPLDGNVINDYGEVDLDGVVYFNQMDLRWGNLMYGESGTIGQSGCGPTSMSIIVSSMTDTYVTPPEMARWAVENGYRAEGNGSYHSLIPAAGIHAGLTATRIGNDEEVLIDALEDDKLVVAIMSKGHFTSGGHFIVLRDITEDGTILVADCASYSRSTMEWDLDIILDEASTKAGSGGPFWTFELEE